MSARLRAVLEARRDAWNARFRRHGRGRDAAAFMQYLARTVDPLVDAAGDAAAAEVAAVLFDLGLAGANAGLVGDAVASPFERALVELLPRFAPHWPADAARLVPALGNAWARLAREVGESRARWWLDTLATAAPQCPTRAVLLDVGLALSWRAGLAEARAAALPRILALEPPFRTWLFGAAEIDPSPARRFTAPGSTTPLGGLAIVGRVGGFVGFGGPFRLPPRAFASGARLFATDGRVVGEVHADVYGARLSPAHDVPSAAPADAATCDAEGRVAWGGVEGAFDALRGATSAAAASAMVAVTLEDSHWAVVLGRPAEAAP